MGESISKLLEKNNKVLMKKIITNKRINKIENLLYFTSSNKLNCSLIEMVDSRSSFR